MLYDAAIRVINRKEKTYVRKRRDQWLRVIAIKCPIL